MKGQDPQHRPEHMRLLRGLPQRQAEVGEADQPVRHGLLEATHVREHPHAGHEDGQASLRVIDPVEQRRVDLVRRRDPPGQVLALGPQEGALEGQGEIAGPDVRRELALHVTQELRRGVVRGRVLGQHRRFEVQLGQVQVFPRLAQGVAAVEVADRLEQQLRFPLLVVPGEEGSSPTRVPSFSFRRGEPVVRGALYPFMAEFVALGAFLSLRAGAKRYQEARVHAGRERRLHVQRRAPHEDRDVCDVELRGDASRCSQRGQRIG